MATLTQPVHDLVQERPARAFVLEQMGIDVHGGCSTLAEACRQHRIDPERMLELLDRSDREGAGDYSRMTLGELCDHIVMTHHRCLREQLQRVGLLLCRVAEGDGERHPELNRVLQLFSVFAGELKLHMSKEEEILFPLIMELEQASTFCGNLSSLVERLEFEDAQARSMFQEIRQLTRGFAVPKDACETYRAVLAALQETEKEIFEHSGIENNVLFPRACQLEQMQLAEVD